MALVVFSSELQVFTGEAETHVKAVVYRDVVKELLSRYPRLEEEKLLEMAIAIDGEIIHDPLLEEVPEDSELHFLYRISGG
jgi:hypothetical protein